METERDRERDRRREEGERKRVAQYRDPAISLMNMDSHFLFFCFNYSINIYKELKLELERQKIYFGGGK